MQYFKDAFSAAAYSGDKMNKVNLFETPRLFCDVYCFEPGQEQAAHVHRGSDKIYLVLEGDAVFQVGSECFRGGPGTAVLALSGQSHSVRNPGPARLRTLVVMAPKPRAHALRGAERDGTKV